MRLSAVTQFTPSTYSQAGGLASDEWKQLTDPTGGELLDIASDNYGAQLTTIARGTAEAAGYGENQTESNVEWRDILKADNGFELGSAFIKDILIQTGYKANQAVKIALYDHTAEMLKLDQLDLTTRDKAVYTREALDIVIQKMLDQATEYGAVNSRLEKTYDNLSTAIENTLGAESTIRDADIAKSMLSYTKNNILVQASQSMLAQANQSSNQVPGLLQ